MTDKVQEFLLKKIEELKLQGFIITKECGSYDLSDALRENINKVLRDEITYSKFYEYYPFLRDFIGWIPVWNLLDSCQEEKRGKHGLYTPHNAFKGDNQ